MYINIKFFYYYYLFRELDPRVQDMYEEVGKVLEKYR